MKKSNKGGKNAWQEYDIRFEDMGNKIPKKLHQPNKLLVLVGNIRKRLTHYIVRRFSISQLDKALEYKLPKNSRVSRAEARGYNMGATDKLNELRTKGFDV